MVRAFSLYQQQGKNVCSCTCIQCCTIVLEVLAGLLGKKKQKPCRLDQKGRSKTILRWHDLICRKSYRMYKTTIRDNKWVHKVAKYKISIKKSIIFLYTCNEQIKNEIKKQFCAEYSIIKLTKEPNLYSENYTNVERK